MGGALPVMGGASDRPVRDLIRIAPRRASVVVLVGAVLCAAGCRPQRQKHLEFQPAPATGAVADVVKDELSRARKERRRMLVYVGATWCEPCQRFHRAAEAGLLDDRFGDVRMLEFDSDRDSERLALAGYTSRLIPLFALPAADGRSTGHQIEGSIKGDGAVQEITPRLESLLAGNPP